ncbi:MAG: hypothetical protein AB7V43_01630 [Acidimicrobiia bacterium]
MTDGPDFLAEAADELVIAATRYQHKRRSQRRAATGAAAAMIIAVGGLIAVGSLRSKDATAEHLTIAPNADGWQVTVIGPQATAADLIRELTDAGIVVERVERHVGPSRVGTVLNTTMMGYQATGRFTIPAGSPVTIEVGIETPKGEDYDDPSSDVFAAGEPLHCLGAKGVDAAALAERIPDHVQVSWFRGLGNSSPISEDDLAGTVVTTATSTKADTVSINVVDGTGPTAPPAC